MSMPFTTITPSNMWERSTWNEILLAYRERWLAIFKSFPSRQGSGFIPETFNIGDAGYLLTNAFQAGIEMLTPSYTPADEQPDGRHAPAFLQWPTINNGNGWRRQTSAGWFYGRAQAGDIVGPWILEDLQAAMSALKTTMYGLMDVRFRDTPRTREGRVLEFENIVNETVARQLILSRYNSDPFPIGTWTGTIIGASSTFTFGVNRYFGNAYKQKGSFFPIGRFPIPLSGTYAIYIFAGSRNRLTDSTFNSYGDGVSQNSFSLVDSGVFGPNETPVTGILPVGWEMPSVAPLGGDRHGWWAGPPSVNHPQYNEIRSELDALGYIRSIVSYDFTNSLADNDDI